jgi:hypothetical protein
VKVGICVNDRHRNLNMGEAGIFIGNNAIDETSVGHGVVICQNCEQGYSNFTNGQCADLNATV